jgi:secreted trypsin-like serine protease
MRKAIRPLVTLLLAFAVVASAAPAFAAEPQYGARIYNGSPASEANFPNVALIMFASGGRCTGSLIAPEWVLTAAHCMPKTQGESLRIGLGGDDLSKGFDEVFTSTAYAAHPRYNPTTLANDVGLIRLPRRSVKPVVRLASREDRAAWQAGVRATIVGWGRTQEDPPVNSSILRSATVIIQEEARCHALDDIYDEGTMMCAGGTGSDACRGDSGGPLLVFSGSNVVQMGITSFGADCGPTSVGFYAWVPAARTWIDATVGATQTTTGTTTPVGNQPAANPVGDQPATTPTGNQPEPSSCAGTSASAVTFADVPSANPHAGAIACVSKAGLAQGLSATLYGPQQAVRRDQMASFIARFLARKGVTLPQQPGQRFSDVDSGNPHATAVNQLAALGVVSGVSGARYAPSELVTRDQMATFIVRTYQLATGQTLPAGTDVFDDDDRSAHERNINAAAAAGLVSGSGPRTYSPGAAVRRDQMASFLARMVDRS